MNTKYHRMGCLTFINPALPCNCRAPAPKVAQMDFAEAELRVAAATHNGEYVASDARLEELAAHYEKEAPNGSGWWVALRSCLRELQRHRREREELRRMLREADCPMCDADDPPPCPWCDKRHKLLGDSNG